MKTRITILISILISTLFVQSCSTKKKAKGPEDVIHVVADSSEFLIIQDALKETFGKIINTPQAEELFSIKRHSINNLSSLKLNKNLIIAAPVNSGSYTSQYIASIVDSNVKQMILADSVFVINKYDLWAENQLVMILTSNDINSLASKIIDRKDDLFYYFRESSNKRLAKGLYNPRFEQRDIEAKLLSNYGWMMYIQADYQLAMDKPEDNFVWLRRGVNTDMERWIFVHWIENSSPEFLDVDSISRERDKLTNKYYTTTDDTAFVVSYDKFKMDSEVNFNDKYALMTQGLWKFNNESGGGPYISYSFYDEETRRIYMLDASIFAPKYLKKSLIQQVDVLLHSFKTESEVDPIKKEEILEELED
jgi:ribosome biogenesis protein Nip4